MKIELFFFQLKHQKNDAYQNFIKICFTAQKSEKFHSNKKMVKI